MCVRKTWVGIGFNACFLAKGSLGFPLKTWVPVTPNNPLVLAGFF